MYHERKAPLIPLTETIRSHAVMKTFAKFTGGGALMSALNPLDYMSGDRVPTYGTALPGDMVVSQRISGLNALLLRDPSGIL